MRRIAIVALVLTVTRCFAAEGVCFRSVGEAATGSGMHDENGYRISGVRHDAFSGGTWAMVEACRHPEWPVRLVAAGGITRPTVAKAVVVSPTLVKVGDRVVVVRVEPSLRVLLPGTAMGSGGAGDTVPVRLAPVMQGAGERTVTAIVGADGTLQMEGA